jgi:hypothetical protein
MELSRRGLLRSAAALTGAAAVTPLFASGMGSVLADDVLRRRRRRDV